MVMKPTVNYVESFRIVKGAFDSRSAPAYR